MLAQVQEVIEIAVGGKPITTTVEGRERYPVRVRYLRELRDSIEALGNILIPTPDGSQIPLTQLSEVTYKRGPDMIKSEDTFLVGYILFDKKPDYAEVEVVEQAREYLQQKIASGEFQDPCRGKFLIRRELRESSACPEQADDSFAARALYYFYDHLLSVQDCTGNDPGVFRDCGVLGRGIYNDLALCTALVSQLFRLWI